VTHRGLQKLARHAEGGIGHEDVQTAELLLRLLE